MSNRNTFTADLFVDELIRAGLRHVCFAPGSRNTPLILAFARRSEDIRIHSHLDERSAAFYALGLGLATGAAAAVVCTSGTAAANFFPAVIEAHQSRVPLLILTTDRPPELRHSGANQTIDQIKIFGDFVRWFVDAGLPEADPPDVALRNLRTLAGRALHIANGGPKGPVHINMPFRKPLEPTPVSSDRVELPAQITSRPGREAHTRFNVSQSPQPDAETISELATVIEAHPNGVIIAGGRTPASDAMGEALGKLARATAYPVLAETVSMMRTNNETLQSLGAYECYLGKAGIPLPEVIIRLGDVPISNALISFISKANPAALVQIKGDGVWSDDSHLTTHFVHADEAATCSALAKRLSPRTDSAFLREYQRMEAIAWDEIERSLGAGEWFDAAAVYEMLRLLPTEARVFAGNSLAIRHVDQFARPAASAHLAYANRGASGIDGNVSTALGIGASDPASPLAAVMGDITLYHDMNGLLALRRCGIPMTLVLLNNNGGGIFHRLPVNQYDPAFTDYFITPHGLEFKHVARLYGLDYVPATNREDFRRAFSESISARHATLIEVQTDAREDLRLRQALISRIHAQIDAIQ